MTPRPASDPTGWKVFYLQDLLQARAHLKTMHGVWVGDVKTMAQMIECHDLCHTSPIGNDVPHTHTRYDQVQDEEWVW